MSQYLLSVHSGEGANEGPPSAPEDMQTMMGRILALEADMEASGAFVFSGRLSGPEAATVASSRDGNPVMTDGPFVEAKEHIAGFYIINADDLDAALAWANKVVAAVGAPIEVRSFFATGRVADQVHGMPGA